MARRQQLPHKLPKTARQGDSPLRRFVGYEVSEVVVAQRLKRMPTILNKLERQPTMDITRMQDIGGCRAVLPSAQKVNDVLGRIAGHWKVERIYDYVTNPKPSGYRATHASVTRDDRLLEIQLRTPGQQQWAEALWTSSTPSPSRCDA